MNHHISGTASDALALIMIANQFDPLFEATIGDFLMKAKLKYQPLSELMALSVKECALWVQIRDIEKECFAEASIGEMDRFALANQRTNRLHEEYRDLQKLTANLRREITELVNDEYGIANDPEPA